MKRIIQKIALPLLITFAAFGFGPCSTDPNDSEQSLESFEWFRGSPASGSQKSKQALIDVIRAADSEFIGVFSSLTDQDIIDEILAAKNRGVTIHLAFDYENSHESLPTPENIDLDNMPALKTEYDWLSNNSILDCTDFSNSFLDACLNPNDYDNFFYNRRYISDQYDSRLNDGKVESNFAVSDSFHCWISSHGADETPFTGDPASSYQSVYSLSIKFKSRDICSDFQREGQQLAIGGQFSDEGSAGFGDIQYNKKISDPNTVFTLGPYRFYIYFGAQERPINPIITNLMDARSSIRFSVQGLSQDLIKNAEDQTKNRSHIFDTFRYKMRIPDLYGGSFSIQGVIGRDDLLTEGTADDAVYHYTDGAVVDSPLTLDTSLHSLLTDTVTYPELTNVDLKKYDGASNEGLGFNLFLIDENKNNPMVIFASDDLRRRFYNDDGNDLYVNRDYADYYNVTDSVVIMVEKYSSESGNEFFEDIAEFVTDVYNNSGGTF